ncbi:hypothetical protein N7447_005554 [Penicillium robsamsonii]|uniref:uncharacterized protein n=1 Tax=Penicillium robsamsonii TaxID=1792511 RepID=UPI002548BCC1|nr:uncharacterized protein N7447_005554 [Penicillium robsamsonii]KAJ5823214.1 hypothetical protein N7447_005554 [Penicillium robsamsonii]
MLENGWQQVHTYADHLGHRVVLEQFVGLDFSPDPDDLVPIQVYSLVSLDDNHKQLRKYLMQSFWDDEVKPLFEVYSYCPPDPFACIEHNRREIARRKQQHRSGVENPPPLIPQFTRPSNYSTVGFCVLLRSHSYRLGYTEDSDSLAKVGEGPDLLYFNRSFSSTRGDVDETQSLSESENENLSPEAFELATERIMNQIDIGQIIIIDIFNNAGRPGLQYALDIDEGEPPNSNLPSEEQIRDQLGQETSVGGFSLDPAFQISQDADIITVTNTPKGNVPDMQYLIHALFLSSIRDTAGSPLLESTARLFTASIVSHLPANKTLTLKFFIPKSSSWSAIHSAQTEVLEVLEVQSHQTQGEDRADPFPIGALNTFSVGDEQSPSAYRTIRQEPQYFITAQEMYPMIFRLFAIVLDRAKFVSEAGVYFYMADCDASGDPDPYWQDSPDDTQVLRGVDMSTIAGRLGMAGLDG